MSADGLTLRPADFDTLRALFADAIRTTGPSAYDAEQVEAWAAAADDARRFRRRLLGDCAMVAEADGEILGVGPLDGDRVSALGACPGLRSGLRAEASAFSLGLFLADGFHAIEAERIEAERIERGGGFDRHLTAHHLGDAS